MLCLRDKYWTDTFLVLEPLNLVYVFIKSSERREKSLGD